MLEVFSEFAGIAAVSVTSQIRLSDFSLPTKIEEEV
jgi:hypothetical protein